MKRVEFKNWADFRSWIDADRQHAAEHPSQWAAIESIASKVGCTGETLRKWVRQAERDHGQRGGLTTDERQRAQEFCAVLSVTFFYNLSCMSDHSAIEWTESTWNPTSGCTKVSPGCDRCYAERVTLRFPKTFPKGFDLTLRSSALDLPLHWRQPRTIFVNSMSDLFHADVPESYIAQVCRTVSARSGRSRPSGRCNSGSQTSSPSPC
jgi:hypothetical protein